MTLSGNFYVLSVIWTLTIRCVNCDELIFVHLLIRHGSRTPIHLFPNDTNTEDTWPQGIGALTHEGIEQGYNLGKFLRQRYVDKFQFISPLYSKKELYARSTDRSRTLRFGTAVLEGLYPERTSALWDPIAVHTRPRELDPTLFMDIPCDRYTERFLQVLQSKEGLEYLHKYKDFISYASKMGGYSNISLENVWDLYDPLAVELINNRTIPEWVTPEVFQHIKDMTYKKFEFYYYTEDLRRMKGGRFVTEIYNNTKDVINGSYIPDRKMNIYIGHDTTMAATLASLHIWDKLIPPVGSVVLIELYRRDTEHFIKIMYKNDTWLHPYGEPRLITLPNCSDPMCPVNKFYTLAAPVLMENDDAWFNYCLIATKSQFTKGGVVAVCVFSAMLFVGLTVLCVWCYRNHQREVRYRPANFTNGPNI